MQVAVVELDAAPRGAARRRPGSAPGRGRPRRRATPPCAASAASAPARPSARRPRAGSPTRPSTTASTSAGSSPWRRAACSARLARSEPAGASPPRRAPRPARSRAPRDGGSCTSPPPFSTSTTSSPSMRWAVELQRLPAREERDLGARRRGERQRAPRRASPSGRRRVTPPQSMNTVTRARDAVGGGRGHRDRLLAEADRGLRAQRVGHLAVRVRVEQGAAAVERLLDERAVDRERDRHVLHRVAELVEHGRDDARRCAPIVIRCGSAATLTRAGSALPTAISTRRVRAARRLARDRRHGRAARARVRDEVDARDAVARSCRSGRCARGR